MVSVFACDLRIWLHTAMTPSVPVIWESFISLRCRPKEYYNHFLCKNIDGMKTLPLSWKLEYWGMWHLSREYVYIMGWESLLVQLLSKFALSCITDYNYHLIRMNAKFCTETWPRLPHEFDDKLKMHGISSLVDRMKIPVRLVNMIIMYVNKWINLCFQSFDHYTQEHMYTTLTYAQLY